MDKIEDEFLTWANANLPLLDRLNLTAIAAHVMYRAGYMAALDHVEKNQQTCSDENNKVNQ